VIQGLSVQAKVILLILALSLVSGVAGAWIMGDLFERHVERSASEALHVAAREFEAQEHSEVEKLSATLDALLTRDDLAAAFVARDRKKLLALSAPLFETMKARDRITHWYFIEAPPAKTVFLRVHRPELHSDVVERSTLQKAIASGDMGAGKELGQTAFALRVVRPWVRDGKVIGYLELAEEIDHFLTAMKSRTGDEYGMLVKKEFLDPKAWAQILGARANTWNDRPDVVVVDTTIFNLGIADYVGDLAEVPDRGRTLGEIVGDDKAWIRGIFPIRDAADRKVGGLFVLHDFTPMHRAVRAGVLQALFVTVAFALATAFALVLAVRGTVFNRLAELEARAEKALEAAGVPPMRVVHLRENDPFARLEALYDRLLAERSPPPPSEPGGEPRRDPPAERGA
jgi:hypothetical protein